MLLFETVFQPAGTAPAAGQGQFVGFGRKHSRFPGRWRAGGLALLLLVVPFLCKAEEPPGDTEWQTLLHRLDALEQANEELRRELYDLKGCLGITGLPQY